MKVDRFKFDDDRALSTKEAAAFLGYNSATLANWRMNNTGPCYIKISDKSVRYRLIDLKTWLKDRLVKTKRISNDLSGEQAG